MNLIIAIGRNVGDEPMDERSWLGFQANVRKVAHRTAGPVVAEVSGVSTSDEWGDEDAAWFAVVAPDGHDLSEFRARLRVLATAYGQDSIAVTSGTTEFVDRVEQ